MKHKVLSICILAVLLAGCKEDFSVWDGAGMDRDDALLCLERHATSKLHEAAELQGIRSLGFRGEAIPSIASMA